MADSSEKESVRNKIRSTIFSGKSFKEKRVNLFGAEVSVRQPSVGMILEMQDTEDRKKTLVKMMINYCYVPETNQKVFEKQDESGLLELPVGRWLNDFNEAVAELTEVNLEVPEKNLE